MGDSSQKPGDSLGGDVTTSICLLRVLPTGKGTQSRVPILSVLRRKGGSREQPSPQETPNQKRREREEGGGRDSTWGKKTGTPSIGQLSGIH